MKFPNFISPKNNFQKGVWWNFLTFVTLGASGVALNVLILIFYGTEILGAFNQVYAVYILASQFAVFGLYSSVLKHISQYSEDKATRDGIFTSALILGAGTAGAVSAIYYFLIPFISHVLKSENVGIGLSFTVIGLWLFAMNKIMLSSLNGKSLMKEFALFSAFRYIMLPVSLAAFIFLGFPGYFAPFIFTSTEFLLFVGLSFFSLRFFSFAPLKECSKWLRRHLVFGAKSFFGGTVVEINSRVDVLMLGIFLSDQTVGIYSLAAMFAEGLEQIPAIFRVNFNPLLTKLVVQNKLKELVLIVGSFLRKWTVMALVVGAVSVLAFPLVVMIVSGEEGLPGAWLVFAILTAGITARSGYSVFWELPSQSGYPGFQTLLVSSVAITNVILNYSLILFLGMYGAAIATAISFILSIFYLKIIVKKTLGVMI